MEGQCGDSYCGTHQELAPVLASETGALKVPHCRDRLGEKGSWRIPSFGLKTEKAVVFWVQTAT